MGRNQGVFIARRQTGSWWDLGIYKRKRDPSGNIVKHKARYCVRGDQQIAGVDYFESYAPVVAWTSVRLMFIMSLIAKLDVV
jgi:Reverse transcriptase (RNA-dependent DNA polymerase)